MSNVWTALQNSATGVYNGITGQVGTAAMWTGIDYANRYLVNPILGSLPLGGELLTLVGSFWSNAVLLGKLSIM